MPTTWRNSLAVGLLLALAAGGAFFIFRGTTALKTEMPAPLATAANSPATPSDPAFQAAPPMKRVMELYETESKRIGRIDPDPKATEKRLAVSARELSADELSWLEGQAMDPRSDPDARFFAVYLLGLSGKESAVHSLTRIALTSIPASKNERLVEQERAHRANAVEGLCAGDNCKIEAAQDGLLRVVSEQTDEFLRDRAHRCLYTCQTGKPIASQDEEALKKVRAKK